MINQSPSKQTKSYIYIDPNQNLILPPQYTSFFTPQIDHQVDLIIKNAFLNQSKLNHLNITNLLQQSSFIKQAVYTQSPIARVQTQLNNIIMNFRVMKSPFFINIKMLHLKRNSIKYLQRCQQSEYTQTYYSTYSCLMIRRFPFKKHKLFNIESQKWEINPNIEQIDIYKLMSLLQVGPQYYYICANFDAICYEDCIEFAIKKLQKLKYSNKNFNYVQFQNRVKVCTRLLHKLNLTYGFYEGQNIVKCGGKLVLDHFELVLFRGQIQDFFSFSVTQFKQRYQKINRKLGIIQDLYQIKQLFNQVRFSKQQDQQIIYQNIYNQQQVQFYQNIVRFCKLISISESKSLEIYTVINQTPFTHQLQCQYHIRTEQISQSIISILKGSYLSPKIQYLKKITQQNSTQLAPKYEGQKFRKGIMQKKLVYLYKRMLSNKKIDFEKGIYLVDWLLQYGSVHKQQILNIISFLKKKQDKNQQQTLILNETIIIMKNILFKTNINGNRIKYELPKNKQRIWMFFRLLVKLKQYQSVIYIYESKLIQNIDQNIMVLVYVELAYFYIGDRSKFLDILNKKVIKKQQIYRNFRFVVNYSLKFSNQNYVNVQDEHERNHQIKKKLNKHLKQLKKHVVKIQQLFFLKIYLRDFKCNIKITYDTSFMINLIKQYKNINFTTYDPTQYVKQIAEYSFMLTMDIKIFNQYINRLQSILNKVQGQNSYKLSIIYIKISDFFRQIYQKSKKNQIKQYCVYYVQKANKLLRQNYSWQVSILYLQEFRNCLLLYEQRQVKTVIQISRKFLQQQNIYEASNPVSLHFTILLVHCYKHLCQTEQMIKCLQKAIRLLQINSNHVQILQFYDNIIRFYIDLKKYDRCIEILKSFRKKIIQRFSQESYQYIYILQFTSQIHKSLNDYQKAKIYDKQIIQKSTQIMGYQSNFINRAYGRLGQTYFFENNIDKAAFCFQNSIKHNQHICKKDIHGKRKSIYYKYLGQCYYEMGEYVHSMYIFLHNHKKFIKQDRSFEMICEILKLNRKYNILIKVIMQKIKQIRKNTLMSQKKLLKQQCYMYLNLCQIYNKDKKYLQGLINLRVVQQIKMKLNKNIQKKLCRKLRNKKYVNKYDQILEDPINYGRTISNHFERSTCFKALKILKKIDKQRKHLLLRNNLQFKEAQKIIILAINQS